MVCNRCIMVVSNQLTKLGVQPESVVLGQVTLKDELNEEKLNAIKEMLESYGFELIDDKRRKLIESIKSIIIEAIHYGDNERRTFNFSDLISEKLGKDYNYLSSLFSEVEGTTIEKYIINQKIEKVKELLVYDELSLSEIAYKMGYSSVAHLSNQFKKVTGLTPSYFKKVGMNRRKPLDKI